VRLLLLEASLGELSVGEDPDDGAVLLDTLELTTDRLTIIVCVLLGVLGECLLLTPVPVPAGIRPRLRLIGVKLTCRIASSPHHSGAPPTQWSKSAVLGESRHIRQHRRRPWEGFRSR